MLRSNMDSYRLTIGLEIHAELKTETKMFCACKNDPDEKRPNVHVCPVCLAHPGTLPAINRKAVKHVLRVGTAIGGTLADFTEFDRKNYFYPDIPKGYQISQFAYPLVRGGVLNGVAVTRVHLEEDTARSSHESEEWSLVDYNRAGVPLMELVTEPVIHSGAEAAAFAKELQLLLRTLGAGDANMEKGEMRVEANISISKTDSFGTKVEVKNLNSFRSVERAIAYEFERQKALLERGEKVIQETRGFDEQKGTTFSQRLKESSHDYRYFPDPDLPKLVLSEIPEFGVAIIRKDLPELPHEARFRYDQLGLRVEAREMLLVDDVLRDYFSKVERLTEKNIDLRMLVVNYLTSDIAGLRKQHGDIVLVRISPESLVELVTLLNTKELSSRGAKDILLLLLDEKNSRSPRTLAKEKGLFQIHDESSLDTYVEEVVLQNAQAVSEYQQGKEASLKFLVGQGMKISRGSANPQILEEKIKSRITERR